MKIDPFPGTLTKQPVPSGRGYGGRAMKWVLTDEQRAWLCKWFPEEENSRLMKMSGMSHSTLHRFAREFGLTKSPKGIKRIKKRQAAHIKKVCERNGYYDSIRGKQPSEACRQARSGAARAVPNRIRAMPSRDRARRQATASLIQR